MINQKESEILKIAEEEGRRAGMEAGRKLGIEAGRKLGIEDGRREGRREGVDLSISIINTPLYNFIHDNQMTKALISEPSQEYLILL